MEHKTGLEHDYLIQCLEERGYPVVTHRRHEYLSYYGLDQSSVYMLLDGVVRASVVTRVGRRFSISYIKGPNPVSLLRDEESSRAESPFNVRVESEMASYVVVPRVAFWDMVNNDAKLLRYVKDYYRVNLDKAMRRTRYLTMNGKTGAVGGFLFELAEEFGESVNGGVRIGIAVTNEDIAEFCGISARSSVSRILKGFREQGIIETDDSQKIVVRNREALERYVMD